MKKRFVGILLTLCMVLTLLPMTALAAEDTLIDGWYNLRCMNNYLNITSDGKAELRTLPENEAFYVTNLSEGHLFLRITLKMKDGRYLGLDGELKNGARVVAMSTPYTWSLHWEKKSEIFSLRPPEYDSMVLNASGEKKVDGTPIIIWTHKGSGGYNAAFNAPTNAEFRFIPVTKQSDPTGESYRVFQEKELYGYKDFVGNIVIPAQFYRAIDFSRGLALVSRPEDSEKYAFINPSGNPVTPYKYNMAGTARTVSDGLVCVCTKVYSAAMQKALNSGDRIDHSEYANGVDTIVMKSGKKFTDRDVTYKYSYINTKGEEVIQTQANDAGNFKNGMATIFHSRRLVNDRAHFKIGWMDTNGKMVIPDHSEEYWWYDNSVHDFEDGLVCYFKASSEGLDKMPAGGILDKTGKVIVPAEPGTFIDANTFGLFWKDGIIAVAPFCKTNENGQRDNNGKYWWQHLYLYDYTGRLIAKPEGYTGGYPLGGGYTLSMYQPLKNKLADQAKGKESFEYWSVFDRNGKKVVEKAEPNNYDLLNLAYGYENGYIFFGNTRIKLGDVPVIPPKHPFIDVKADSYYEEAVIWAKENGVTGGTSATTFAPDATCTRGQVVTFLWRAKGSPEPKSANNPFTDVKLGDYYYKAVLWAVEQGITGGTAYNTFSPNANCTGGQVVTFLWRSNGRPASTGMDTPYYAKAVSWAADKGLLDNMGGFYADKPSPRADIVTYLYRNAK